MPRTRNFLAAYVASVGLWLAAAVGVAQEVEPRSSYPADFVHALLGASEGDLIVGEMPAFGDQEVPWPDDVRLVGSWQSGPSTTVVGVADQLADNLRSAYLALLIEQGWETPESRVDRGFVSNEPVHVGLVCKDGLTMYLWVEPVSEQMARLKLSVYSGSDLPIGGCGSQHRRRRADPYGGVPFPRLQPPDGVKFLDYRSSSSSGPGEQAEGVLVTTDLPAAELAQHYGRQMRDAGWNSLGYCQDQALTLESYEMVDDEDRRWFAHLSIVERGGEENQLSLKINVTAADPTDFYY